MDNDPFKLVGSYLRDYFTFVTGVFSLKPIALGTSRIWLFAAINMVGGFLALTIAAQGHPQLLVPRAATISSLWLWVPLAVFQHLLVRSPAGKKDPNVTATAAAAVMSCTYAIASLLALAYMLLVFPYEFPHVPHNTALVHLSIPLFGVQLVMVLFLLPIRVAIAHETGTDTRTMMVVLPLLLVAVIGLIFYWVLSFLAKIPPL